MDDILLHNSFILFEIICVIAVFAIFIIRSRFFTEILDHNPGIFTQLLFMVFFGLLSIVGTVTGVGLFGSIGNVRDIGPMIAGLTCGPVIGLGAGIIGGIFRFLQGGPYMYTGLSAPILCGILGGILYLANNRNFVPTWLATLYMALCDTLISIYTLTLITPPDQLWMITKNIAIPMIVGSTIGVFIFSSFIHIQMGERNKENELKRLERENADQKNLDAIMNTLGDPVFLINKDLCWKLVNDKFCDFFEKNREKFIHQEIKNFFRDDEYKIILEQCNNVFQSGKSHEIELTITNQIGQIKTIILKSSLLIDSNEEHFVVGIIRDISDRKKMEETIRENESRLSSILHGSPVMQFVINKEHHVLYWNRALEKFTGYSTSSIIGTGDYWKPFYKKKHPMLVDLIVDEDLNTISKWYGKKVREAQFLKGAYEGIEFMPGSIAESSGKWYLFSAAPIYDTKENLIGAIETLQDITENKNLEFALKLSLKKINLLSSITRHDLQNKLTVLKGFMFLLSESIKDPALIDILDRINKTNDSIHDQLAFTREYQELGIKDPIWQNLNEIISGAIQELNTENITFVVNCVSFEIYADPLLKKVFYNLFENAKRHGNKISTIEISSMETESGLKILVSDDGIGIPDDEKKEIFERGYGKNTGFGLFLSSEILAITDITISETGTYGTGAVFEIHIPKTGYRKIENPK